MKYETPHITHHTSHITHHTSHITHHTSQKESTYCDQTIRSTGYQWYWKEDDWKVEAGAYPSSQAQQGPNKSWIKYDEDQNRQIEAAFVRGDQKVTVTGDLIKVKNGGIYDVYFPRTGAEQGYQKRQDTGHRRKVKREAEVKNSVKSKRIPKKRIPKKVYPSLPALPENWSLQEIKQLPMKTVYVTIRGLKEAWDPKYPASGVLSAKQKLKSLVCSETFQVLTELTPEVQEQITCILGKRSVTVTGFDPEKKTVSMEGLAPSITEGKVDVLDHLAKALQREEFPEEWQPIQTSGSTLDSPNCSLFTITPSSQEWEKIEDRMRETMPQVRLVEVKRIQNKHLWRKYAANKESLANKWARDSELEMELFHGTSSKDPSAIYNGEVGFDHCFSRQGMWGKGIYFAANFEYSHKYANDIEGGKHKQLLLARVLTGEVHTCPSDCNISRPPEHPRHGEEGARFQHMYYDSVSGETGGSKVYIVYHSHLAYPTYLIKYSV